MLIVVCHFSFFFSRDMDLDRRVRGVAYIGRIKSMDSHQGEEEVYGVV